MTEDNGNAQSDGSGPPAPGHNSNDDAVIAVNLSKIRVAQDKNGSANSDLRSTLKHAEGKGLDLVAAKKALQIAKSGDAEAFIETTQNTLHYLKILGHGVPKAQIDLFDYTSELAPIDEKAAEAGRSAGWLGELESANPHDLSTQAGQAWLGAYRQGCADREGILALTAKDGGTAGADEGGLIAAPLKEGLSKGTPGPGGFNDDLEEPPPESDEQEGAGQTQY